MPPARPAIPCAGTWSVESQTATGRSCSETVNLPLLKALYQRAYLSNHVLRVSPLRNVDNKNDFRRDDVMAY